MPVAWGSVRGHVVFDSAWCPVREQAATGFSTVGTRNLLLTDYPAVYVHDTGGLGSAFIAALEPAGDPGVTVELAERSTRLIAEVQLPQGRSIRLATVGPLSPETLSRLAYLGGKLLPDVSAAAFASPCAVSVTLRYEPATSISAMVQPLTELAAYVVVKGNRLELRSRGQVLVYWPVNRIAVTPAGPTDVEVRGGAVLYGRLLTGVVLHLMTERVAQRLLTVVGTAQPEPAAAGASAPVSARGLGGSPRAVNVDCVLGESTLELQGQDTAGVLARFDLADPQLRVAGSAERFVVFNPEHGPVSVQSGPGSEVFGRRLHAHPAVRAAAERTLAAGPYPAELADGGPVVCHVPADAVRVKGSETDLKIPFERIRHLEGELAIPRAMLRMSTDHTEVAVTGQLELVQALHTEIVAGRNAALDPRQVPELLRAAAGLEEDYFLYTVFGPFYELHAALLGDATADRLGTEATMPEPPEERTRVIAVLSEGLAELQRHLDQVGSTLPAFVRYRDAQLLAVTGGEPGWLKAQEGQLRLALAPVQRVAAETGQLAAQATRLLELDPEALPKPSYGGAAISLGAAALLSPVFAVSGISQAYSQYSQGKQRKAEISARSQRGWELALERWNTLVRTTVPVVGYVLTENVFGLRWEVARRITTELRGVPEDRRPRALRAVSRRLARLDVMRRYPVHAGIRLRRGEIADHLRAARDAITTPRFHDF
jgi:hypothetical protein